MQFKTIEEWRDFTARVERRYSKLQNRFHDEGWKLAQSVGIGHCGCSLHNASIDDAMTGWCAGNPERLRVAKIANAIVGDWTYSQRAHNIVAAAWNALAKSRGWAHD